jgi:hypothetical protein
VSLPAGVDKSKIDFAALIKTGSAPVAVEVSQRDTFVRMAESGAPVTATFHQPGPLGIHFSDRLPLRVIKARPSPGIQLHPTLSHLVRSILSVVRALVRATA